MGIRKIKANLVLATTGSVIVDGFARTVPERLIVDPATVAAWWST